MKRLKMLFACLLLAASAVAFAQSQRVNGTVTDKNGEPLAGVSVVVEGTTLGVVTDINGKYAIDAKPGQTLSFYFYGMKSQKVEVSGAEQNIKMEDDALALDEAVVTALGITRSEKSLGYAATTVKNDEIATNHATNVTNALAGKVAGLQISATTTDPGAGTNVIIRGYSSINGSNQPLYVVDGIVVPGMGSLSTEDIESLTVLKGAAATALYGSRAANGVIVISTKQGTRGAERLFSIEYSGGLEARQVSLLPVYQNDFGQGWNGTQTFIENGSWGPRFDGSQQVYGPIWNGQQLIHEYSAKPTNVKDFFEYGVNQKHSIALNGSSEDQRANYYLSYSLADDNGIMPGDKDTYTRNSIAYRGSYVAADWLKVSSQINFMTSKTNSIGMFQGTSVIDGLYEFPRDISLVDLKNLPAAFNSPEAYLTPYGITSPYWAIENRYAQTDSKQIFGKIQVDAKPTKHLTFTYRYSFNYRDYDYKYGEPQIALDDALIWDDMGYAPSKMNADGYVYAEYYRNYETNHDFLATYNNDFLDGRLNVNAIAGVNANERYSTQLVGQTDGLTIYSGFWNLSNGATKTTISDSQSKRRLIGVFGDVTFAWDDSIFLELTARNDWSSTLPVDNNNYFYPGATLSWIFTNYLPKNDVLSFGKLRLAYGRTGNDASPYNTYATFSQASFYGTYASGIVAFPINGTNAFRRGYSIASPELKPEMTTESEVGLNLQFFNGRFGVDAAYYNRLTSDQIFPISIEPATGYSSMVSNAGDVRNSGIELLFDFVPVQTKDFRWDVSVNFAKNNSLVVDLPAELGEKFEIDRFSTSGTKDVVSLYAEKGKPFGTYWTYVPTYVEDASSPYNGCLIVDSDGMPVLSNDLVPTGFDANYDWTGGVSTSLRYKNLSFSASLDMRKGGKMFSRSKNIMEFTGNGLITTYNNREPFIVPNSAVAVTDDDGKLLGYAENTTPIYLNDSSYQTYFDEYGAGEGRLFYLVDRSFVKLRNVSISYNLPKKWIGPFQGISVSAFVNNAYTWTAKDNYYVDPESTNNGTDTDGLMGETYVNPSCRIWGFNVNVKF
ncbi:MAG: SusC/RagA family TonB-linked outer membrane protein [Bacteroidales bacterium]|nr:SusC/RagA family TonB-linked outer membrane protein [Bacteroidales bacterium]